jgi:hypothetical protein
MDRLPATAYALGELGMIVSIILETRESDLFTGADIIKGNVFT